MTAMPPGGGHMTFSNMTGMTGLCRISAKPSSLLQWCDTTYLGDRHAITA